MRSPVSSILSIAQNEAWFVVTTGLANRHSHSAIEASVGKLPPGTTMASISGRSMRAKARRACSGPSLPIR
jgi:hypothetical protein